nr:unnamed protein product [Callosobruchus analis]
MTLQEASEAYLVRLALEAYCRHTWKKKRFFSEPSVFGMKKKDMS